MKTILINRTLTTIALLSTIQCGYGTETVSITNWNTLTSSGSTYTFNKGSNYTLNILSTDYLNQNIKLIIPGDPNGVEVTNDGYMYVNSNLEIENNGSFGNIKGKPITTYAENSSITFSGDGDINNEKGSIYTNKENSSIMFSAGTADKPQIVKTSGTSSRPGQIYLGKANSSATIGQDSTLSFGDYGKFYVSDSNTHNVTLNGTIAIKSTLASVDVSKMNFFPGTINNVDKDSHGTIDMSKIQEYSANVDLSQPLDLCGNSEQGIPATFTCEQLQQLPNIKLPFNCKFSNVDLRNAASVSYTVLKIIDGVEVDGNKVIKKKVTGTYGDYANDSNLGVILPSTTDVTTETQGNVNMYLAALVSAWVKNRSRTM